MRNLIFSTPGFAGRPIKGGNLGENLTWFQLVLASVFCLVLVALPVPSSGTDAISLNATDDESGANTITPVPFVPFDIYLYVENPSDSQGLLGWECEVYKAGPDIITAWSADGTNLTIDGTLPGGVSVSMAPALPWDPGIRVATLTCMALGSNPTQIFILPHASSSVDPMAPAYLSGTNGVDWIPLTPENGSGMPAFTINPSGTPSQVTVDVTPDDLAFEWVLTSANVYFPGRGDMTFTDIVPETYSLYWTDRPGWQTPTPSPQVQTLPSGGAVTFTGTYVELGTVVIDVVFDVEFAWVLEGALGYYLSSFGSQTLTDMVPDTYTLTWEDYSEYHYKTPSPNPDIQALASGDTITFDGDYLGYAALSVEPLPESLNASWTVTGLLGFSLSGSGLGGVYDLEPDTYTVTWDDSAGWKTPVPVVRTLDWWGSEYVTGTYLPYAKVAIDPDPDWLDAPWDLVGDAGYSLSGAGDELVSDLEPDTYTLTWGEVSGWGKPIPDELEFSTDWGKVLVLEGTYYQPGIVNVNPGPDFLNAPWQIEGPFSGFFTGGGDSTLTDMIPGDHTITWDEVTGWQTPAQEIKTLLANQLLTFDCVYWPLAPYITSIADVAEDQGGQVRLTWLRSVFDAPADTVDVTGYEVYRRQDAVAANSLPVNRDQERVMATPDLLSPGWDFLGEVPAHGDSTYHLIVPTLCDSIVGSGICWSVLKVLAVTPDPFIFLESAPDSGYSVDNLAPGVPEGVKAAYEAGGVALDWNDAPEPDFQFFRIYRDTDPGFVPTPGNLVQEVSASAWADPTADPWDYYYKITALDQAGNESEAGAPASVTGVRDGVIPTRTALLGAVPNPFNPSTKLPFEMAAAGHARLKVFDTAGRLVATLVDEHRHAGNHHVIWDGRDNAGRMSSAGVYLYRLEVGDFLETKRMTLIK